MNLKAAMERSKLSSGVRRELRKRSGGGGGGVEGEGKRVGEEVGEGEGRSGYEMGG